MDDCIFKSSLDQEGNRMAGQCMHPTKPVLVLIGLASSGLMLACNLTARLTPTVQILEEGTSITVTRTLTEPVMIEPIQTRTPSKSEPSKTSTLDIGSTMTAVAQANLQLRNTLSAAVTATQAIQQTRTAQASTPTPTHTPTITASPSPKPTEKKALVDRFDPVVTVDEIILGRVRELRPALDGTLWLASDSGIASLDATDWTVHFTDGQYLLAGFDADQRLWMVRGDGTLVMAWDGSTWKTYGADQGWPPINTPFATRIGKNVITDLSGRVWMTTFQDVRAFDGQSWQVYRLEEMGFVQSPETAQYEGFALPALSVDQSGNMWVGDCDSQGEAIVGQGARWFDGDTWRGAGSPVDHGCVRDIVVDAAGDVWLGVDGVLWHYALATGNWASFIPPKPPIGIRFGWIDDITLGLGGEIWASLSICGGASCGGFQVRYKIKDGVWTQIGDVGDYYSERVFFDADGDTWLYSEGTLYRIEVKTLELVEDLKIQAIAQDGLGRLWFVAEQKGKIQVFRQVFAGEVP